MRGMETMTADDLLALLRLGRDFVLRADGVWDVVELDDD
jgi:hypothetical protein